MKRRLRQLWLVAIVVLLLVIGLRGGAQDLPASPVLVGGEPIFELQSTEFRSEIRAFSVNQTIAEFLRPQEQGNVPALDVRSNFDPNGQFVLILGERDRFAATERYLFTVTYQDAAAVLGKDPEDVSLQEVQQVAEQWATELREAISTARDEVLTRQPLFMLFGTVSALAVLLAAYPLMGLSDKVIARVQPWFTSRLALPWHRWIVLVGILCTWSMRLLIAWGGFDTALQLMPLLRPFRRQLYQRLTQAFEALNQPLVPNSPVTIQSIISFAVLAVLVLVLARNLSNSLKTHVLPRLGLNVGLQDAIATGLQYSITLLGILIVLPFIGIDLSSLFLIAGAVGFGLGFGLQNLSNNFVSGVAVLLERPIQVGDLVEVDGWLGTVEQINLRATTIRTLDRLHVIVPNSRFMEANVVNWSYRDPRCRIRAKVGVAYGSDTALVIETLLQVAKANARVLSVPPPQAWMTGFGDSSLNFELLVWISRPQDQFMIRSELNLAIDAAFRQHHISIPFPQRDLHIRNTAPPSFPLPPSSLPDSLPESSAYSPPD